MKTYCVLHGGPAAVSWSHVLTLDSHLRDVPERGVYVPQRNLLVHHSSAISDIWLLPLALPSGGQYSDLKDTFQDPSYVTSP